MTSVERAAGERGPVVDYLCNAFLPDRQALWDEAIAATGVNVRVRRGPDEAFCTPEGMVARMDALGVDTVLVPAGDLSAHAAVDPRDYDHFAFRWHEYDELTKHHPGRFGALLVVDPARGFAGVRTARERLETDPTVVGMYLHTHSWDRRFDHADYYPWYALCADLDVPIAMQAGTSGGLMASECGHPIGIDRPALYFPGVRFVLSHTGWPWVDEAVALALKFPNVYLGTGAYPPRHWHPSVHRFLAGPGRRKVLFGTNFPTVAHAAALDQIAALELRDDTRARLLGGTAREVFTRLGRTP
ncbi:amidohydrolase family protein [Yinghuangia seranimata]|uniref:amidohydrolase family protein n=1 Tax=Yinghuangia seranimata TaxID=408067 RepID=UPI00248C617B|nr:amidohydrolase family protein [Yinghuangia seranimata]MDI2127178.1 amidohydrolase family protein [Yinghuangia seranimata]